MTAGAAEADRCERSGSLTEAVEHMTALVRRLAEVVALDPRFTAGTHASAALAHLERLERELCGR